LTTPLKPCPWQGQFTQYISPRKKNQYLNQKNKILYARRAFECFNVNRQRFFNNYTYALAVFM